MASLDDIPTLPPTTPTSDDLIAVVDGSDRRSPKRASLAQLGSLLGGSTLTPADIVVFPGGGVTTVTTRVTVFNFAEGSAFLPPPDGALREIFIINDTNGSVVGNVIVPTLAAGHEVIAPQTSAHLLSDGVGWYRVS